MADLDVGIKYVGSGNEIAVITAKGYIDTVTAPELEKKLQELMASKTYRLIVNLKDVSYISSAGWGIFVSELRDIRDNKGDLVLVEMTPDVYDVYELMEFSSILKSFETMDEAFRNFKYNPVDPSDKPADQRAAEAPASAPAQAPAASPAAASMAAAGLSDKVVAIIQANPYFDEKQIRTELGTPNFGNTKVGFFEIKKILKDLGLEDGKKRFEFAMKNK